MNTLTPQLAVNLASFAYKSKNISKENIAKIQEILKSLSLSSLCSGYWSNLG
jgi:hypothetical protein